MPHHTSLIATIVAGIGLAFVFGALAQRLRLSPLVGYLVAGVLIGPFTPGYVADQELAPQLAEIGVILLMFGVGLHFSLSDLLAVRAIAVPGAIGQIAFATLLGMALAHALGWPFGAGIVFGLALSVASTVVLLRALQERRMIETERGRIAVGWLIVEDLAMVLALVLLPALSGLLGGRVPEGEGGGLAASLGATGVWAVLALTVAKVAAFVALMLVVGRRLIPWILHAVAHSGSRELFRLAVLAIALGVAFGSAELFGVSFALGAFFAGMVMGESDLSQRATEEAIPLRDAFAVLFFVSVGMLLNPMVFVEAPLAVLATVAIIVVGKSAIAWLIVRAFRHSNSTALTVAASLAQIGEFSFILIGLGMDLNMVPKEARDLVLAGAIVSIILNPLAFILMERLRHRPPRKPDSSVPDDTAIAFQPTSLSGHDILIGYGRVGSLIGQALAKRGMKMLVIETSDDGVEKARQDGAEVLVGNAADPEILTAANVAGARRLFVTIPEPFEAGQAVQQARSANPTLDILARAHSNAAVDHLSKLGANLVVLGEAEIADRMVERAQGRNPPSS
jgi:CPA2 family monovalent cation:H+ antiporter-2